MQKKIRILVNGITIEDANLVPLTKKIENWNKGGAEITLLGTKRLAVKLEELNISNHVYIDDSGQMGGGYSFILNSIIRNISAFKKINKIGKVDVVYSISSVLDLILFPFIFKKTNRVKKWVTVFDNTVPLISEGRIISGNFAIRLMAWLFFQVSLILLKSADCIFVVKPELKQYLLSRGFKNDRLIVTGNGVERDLILEARTLKKYQTDALFVGRINEAKGIYDLLSVMSIVVKKNPKFTLTILGSGDSKTVEKYLQKIKDLGLSENIQLLGFKTGQEKYDRIKSSKIFLFLSQTESVPVAPLEAVCSGKITFVYDLDAYSMYKNNEVVTFKLGDYESVARKIIDTFKTKDFSNKAGELLLDKYDWGSIAQTELKSMS